MFYWRSFITVNLKIKIGIQFTEIANENDISLELLKIFIKVS